MHPFFKALTALLVAALIVCLALVAALYFRGEAIPFLETELAEEETAEVSAEEVGMDTLDGEEVSAGKESAEVDAPTEENAEEPTEMVADSGVGEEPEMPAEETETEEPAAPTASEAPADAVQG